MSRFNRNILFWSILLLLFLLFVWDFSLISQAKRTHPLIVGGLHPISDAFGYFSEASTFAYRGFVTDWGARRAIFPIFVAGLLKLFREDLYSVHIIFAALGAMSSVITLFAALAIGPLITALFSMISLLLFIVVLVQGNIATESLSLFFGSSAALFLIISLETRSKQKSMIGLLLLSLAMAIRPGPLLVLPALAIFFAFANKDPQHRTRAVLLNLFIVALPFVLTSYLTRSLSSTPQVPFSNAASVIYGLAKGGAGWGAAYSDHPNITAFSEAEQAEILLQSSIRIIAENPSSLVKGVFRSYLMFVRQGGMFGYMDSDWITIILFLLFIFTMLLPLFVRTDSVQKFLSISSFFAFLSAPISLDGGWRVMAAVMPIVSLALFTPIIRLARSQKSLKAEALPICSVVSLILPVVLVFLYALWGPTRSEDPISIDIDSACLPDQRPVYLSVRRGSVTVIDDSHSRTIFGKSLSTQQWRRFLPVNEWEKHLLSKLKLIKSGDTVITSYDYLSGALLWIISDLNIDSEIGKPSAWCTVCDPEVPHFCRLKSKIGVAASNQTSIKGIGNQQRRVENKLPLQGYL